MKFSTLSGLVGVLLLGAFDNIQGTVNFHHQDEQLENPLMEVRHLCHSMVFLELNKTIALTVFFLAYFRMWLSERMNPPRVACQGWQQKVCPTTILTRRLPSSGWGATSFAPRYVLSFTQHNHIALHCNCSLTLSIDYLISCCKQPAGWIRGSGY